ncbi:MAG TPA: hypothetical protein VF812_18405 [Ktedonobacterales bacterium]
MKWFWQRRKKESPLGASSEERQERESRGAVATAPRPAGISGRLATTVEPRDELLRFARDLLNAQGARVRAEEDDLIVATQPDGSVARYTTTLARARAEEETTLLAQGAAALQTLFDEAAQRARLVALRLPASDDEAHTLALRHLAPLPEACGRCVGLGGEPWLSSAPTCDACPMRAGRPALTWAQPPVTARTLRQSDAQSVELVYRIIGRDRRGRRDEWLRLAFDAASGRKLPPMPLDLLPAAQPAEPSARANAQVAEASAHAQETLRPALDALSVSLRQRVADEYQRRIEEVTTTHERLRRERPEDGDSIAAALERELASLSEVYGVEVEARLESVVFISSPVALVAVETAQGVGPSVLVDLGRGMVSAPACAVCSGDTRAGHICAQGHTVCATHLSVCATCGATRCPVCDPTPMAACALCGDLTCAACAGACDDCGHTFCSGHTWRCAEGDATLCLEHLNVCAACGDPLCQTHTSQCGACGDTLCQRHARRCKTCGDVRCETHAQMCDSCGQALCERHAIACEECGKPICQEDVFTCQGCGRQLGACAGRAACASCGADYCVRCRDEAEACPACRALAAPGDDDLLALRQAADREPAINLKRKWQVGRNALARVFITRGLGREEAWIITNAGEVIAARRKGWLAR